MKCQLLTVLAAGVFACTAAAAPLAWVPPTTTSPEVPVVVHLTAALANIEYSRAQFHHQPPAELEAGSLTPRTGQWYGRIERRIPVTSAVGKRQDVEIVATYDGLVPASVRCDTNLDGDLKNDPDLPLYEYPPVPGALSAFADLRWDVSADGSPLQVSWRIRIVVEPIRPGESVPVYHIQSVNGLVGEVSIDGRKHRAFMFDGNRDGIYSRGFGDGMFVDLNDDQNVWVDPSTDEFLPFGARSQMGHTVFETTLVTRDGTQVEFLTHGGAAPVSPLRAGEQAPDFTFRDPSGSEIRLSAYKGHPVIVYFWAGWCGACEGLAPRLRETYDLYHPRGLEVIGISFDDDPALYSTYRDRHGEPWASFYSGHKFWENPVGRIYGVHAAGVAYLIDPQGNFVGYYYDFDELDKRLDDYTQGALSDPHKQ